VVSLRSVQILQEGDPNYCVSRSSSPSGFRKSGFYIFRCVLFLLRGKA